MTYDDGDGDDDGGDDGGWVLDDGDRLFCEGRV